MSAWLTRLNAEQSAPVVRVVDGVLAVIQHLTLAVDRALDMMRGAANPWNDSVGAAVITRLEGGAS